MEAAGGKLTHPQFAKSLLPAARGECGTHREDAIAEMNGEVMIQNQEWKLVLNADGEPYLLFDRIRDPEERTNRIADPELADIRSGLQQRLLQRIVQSQLRRNDGVHTNKLLSALWHRSA